MTRVLIQTYGCTLNQADSDIMESMLIGQGYEVARGEYNPAADYDYVIVNTCTVKSPTEQKILDRLEKMKHLNSRLIVAGCMASANIDKVAKIAPMASMVSTSNVHRIAEAINEISSGHRTVYGNYSRVDKAACLIPSGSVITRIPISEGCLSSCSFCETKLARGPLNSFSGELILRAIKTAVEKGAKEIELTSQDVGAYGLDRKTNIAELVSAATEIEGNFKIRIGMLNPAHLDKYFDKLVDAYKSDKIYKFIHLPVQSGSNKVLNEMDRQYSVEEFKSFVAELKKKVDDISIATDMIVGYPTETEADFEESVTLIGESRPSRINISKFGARPRTKAARLRRLGNAEVKERCIRMYRLARRIEVEALTRVLGERRMVLITEAKEGSLLARDSSYREVAVSGDHFKLGDSIEVDIYGSAQVCLLGRPSEMEIAAKNQ